MGVKERREREKAELRSRILEAAAQLFVDEGVSNVSIRKIADRIEYSPATIYLYFRDKEHLISCVCEETFATLKDNLNEISARDLHPVAALRAGLRYYIDFGLAHPHHYLLTFCTPQRVQGAGQEAPDDTATNTVSLEAFDTLRRALLRCREAGAIKFDDVELTAQSVWTFIHGTVSLLITCNGESGFPWVEEDLLIENSLDLILKGLGAKVEKGGRRLAAAPLVG